MKERIEEFVQKRQAVLELKKAHNKKVGYRLIIKEAILIGLILFGIIPIFGFIGNLNMEYNYVLYSVHAMIIISYFLLLYLYELRVRNIVKKEYNVFYIVIPKVLELILVLTIATLVSQSLFALLLLNLMNQIIVLVVVSLVLLAVIVYFLFLFRDRLGDLKSYLKAGIVYGFIQLTWLELLFSFDFVIQYILSTIATILFLVLRETLMNYEKTRVQKHITRWLLFIFVLFMIVQFRSISQLSNLTSTSFIRRGDVVVELPKGRIIGMHSSDDYLFVKYRDANGSHYKIYNHDFEYLDRTEDLSLSATLYTEGESTFIFYFSSGEVELLKMNDSLDFVEEFKVTVEGSRYSIPFYQEGSYFFISRGYNESESNMLISSFNKVTNGRVETVLSLGEGILYQSDTMLYIVKGDTVFYEDQRLDPDYNAYYASLRNEDTFDYPFEEHSLAYYDNLVLFGSSNEEEVELATVEEVKKASVALVPSIYYGSYPVLIKTFSYEDNLLWATYFTDMTIDHELEVVLYRYDVNRGSSITYHSKDGLVKIDQQYYELVGKEFFELDTDMYDVLFGAGFDSPLDFSVDILYIGILLFTALKTKRLVLGGVNHV